MTSSTTPRQARVRGSKTGSATLPRMSKYCACRTRGYSSVEK
uniref:Uncharacterized protein n=1 Tax=Arundo donax TaxID=35708 RepID=A0A0A9C6D3_ARUDO